MHKFLLQWKKLDIEQNHKYLGSVISCSGSNITAEVKLQEQADKAYFALQKTMLKIGYDPRYCLDLFIKSIRPILIHNCEILNQISEKKIKAVSNGEKQLEQLYFEFPAEKVHLRLCRNILGVSNKTSCLAVLGELSEYPVDIFAYTQMVQYWHRIAVKMKRNSLIYKVFNAVQEEYQDNHFNWMNTIRFLLNYCNLNRIWENPASISTKALGNKVKHCL